jgi:chromosome segregation ATPase
MIINEIELFNFMIFGGKHTFKLSKNVNLIVGKNESGKSILSTDALKYVLQKRVRFKKMENVLNNMATKDDHGYVSIASTIDDIEMTFKRYLQHGQHKNNLRIFSDNNAVTINGSGDSFANIKNVSVANFLKNLNVHLDYFDLVSVYNPSKDIIVEKKYILDLLSVNFNNIVMVFDTIYRTFEVELSVIQNEVIGMEKQLLELTKSTVKEVNDENKINEENKKIAAAILKFKSEKLILTDALGKINGYVGEKRSNVSSNEKEIKKLAEFYKSGICRTCERPFDDAQQKNKLKNSIINFKKEIDESNEMLKSLLDRVSRIKDSINIIDSKIWKLMDKSKENEKRLVNNDSKIETMRSFLTKRKKDLVEIEEKLLGFKRRHEAIFSTSEVNAFIKSKIQSFEQVYEEIYNIITQSSINVRLNLNKYEESEFGDFYYSGLSTSKKRLTYLVMMLALHTFCNIKLNFLILDEFFDVFDFDNMVKILETIFSTSNFKNLQFIITSNNDDLIGLVKNNPINLINLIDYTK